MIGGYGPKAGRKRTAAHVSVSVGVNSGPKSVGHPGPENHLRLFGGVVTGIAVNVAELGQTVRSHPWDHLFNQFPDIGLSGHRILSVDLGRKIVRSQEGGYN